MIKTSDGLSIAYTDVGPKNARALVFIHGIAQSKHSWDPLLEGPLAQSHRLVAFDLRGHGASDKPSDPAFFVKPRLANDLAAVIDALNLDKPILVAWSYGAVVVGEYLRQYGEDKLGGIVYAAGAILTGRESRVYFGPVMQNEARAMISEDPAAYAAATPAFLRGCSVDPIPQAAFDHAVEQMLLVPAHVRRGLLHGGEDYRPEVSRTTIPMATIHGEKDAVVLPTMSEIITTLRPNVQAFSLPNIGHVPWIENPAAFTNAMKSFLASS